MDENHFIAKKGTPIPFTAFWEAPSNIALIKYWGKTAPQIPKNPSLSFTLSSSVSQTEVFFQPSKLGKFDFTFYFEGIINVFVYDLMYSFSNVFVLFFLFHATV